MASRLRTIDVVSTSTQSPRFSQDDERFLIRIQVRLDENQLSQDAFDPDAEVFLSGQQWDEALDQERRAQLAEAARRAADDATERKRQREEERVRESRLQAERLAQVQREAEEERQRREKEAAVERAQRELAEASRATDAAAARWLYGQAYHRLFAGDLPGSRDLLDVAIRLDDRSAVYFYFRGLTRLRSGDRDGANDDFRRGGACERQNPAGVGVALERVQGPDRRDLEAFRSERMGPP